MPLNYLYAHLKAAGIARRLKKLGPKEKSLKLPIIYVGGILGTKLYDRVAGLDVWGNPSAVLRPKDGQASYALPLPGQNDKTVNRVTATEHLHAFSIVPKILDTLVTAEMVMVLAKCFGYSPQRDLFFIGHDWRQDYRLLADRLDAEITRLETMFGPEVKFVLMGQSVANPAIRFWLRRSPSARARLVRWYAFGPPWQGTFHALDMLCKGYYPAGKRFRGFTPAEVGTFPSCYQLLPTRPRVITEWGEPLEDFSFYNLDCWRRYGLLGRLKSGGVDLNEDRLAFFLEMAQSFTKEALAPDETVDRLPQVWFLGEANQAVRAAVFSPQHGLLVKAKDILRLAPKAVPQALAPGDDHLPLEDFARNPNGPFVRDPHNLPFGNNYMFLSRPHDHRAIINHQPVLEALVFDLAAVML